MVLAQALPYQTMGAKPHPRQRQDPQGRYRPEPAQVPQAAKAGSRREDPWNGPSELLDQGPDQKCQKW
eukprot:CAMPEP_0195042620 /NCGR_PEP_ID=MMETSP0347-20130606/2924_1 /TAXON_ID=2932 /ORGANISM="Alexandrium fundyense, Strain CCMP1719" /LENGTH=67 /DNA_ID=CAMNT_0040069883 /DNA_START=60 /DNA_END=263 /DNA_ORIENTATION=+